MELKTYFAQDVEGNVIPGAQVFVYQAGTMSLATGLQDPAGNALSNPFNGGLGGAIQFAAPDGDYDMRVSSGVRQYTVRVRFIDATQQLVQINQLAQDAAEDALLAQQNREQAVAAAAAAEAALAAFDPAQFVLPSGTKMLFAQTAAPTGWTKDTTHDNKALRVVTGTAGSGGSVAFTTAFASQAVSGTVGNTTLTEAQIPSHSHSFGQVQGTSGGQVGLVDNANSGSSGLRNTANTGGGGSHNHTFTGTAINLAVQYVDVIIATKD